MCLLRTTVVAPASTRPRPLRPSVRQVAGSTTAGILRRLAYHHGINGAFTDDLREVPPDSQREPELWASTTHLSKAQEWMGKREKGWALPTFVVGWMRDPLARCMSSYYFFQLCRAHNNASDGSDQVVFVCLVLQIACVWGAVCARAFCLCRARVW